MKGPPLVALALVAVLALACGSGDSGPAGSATATPVASAPSPVSTTVPSATPTANLVTDPFVFCAAVTTADSPAAYEGPVPARYAGAAFPFESDTLKLWRCSGGAVLGCEAGPTGRQCAGADLSREPSPELRLWCEDNPDAPFVAFPVVPPGTVWEWACEGVNPVTLFRAIPDSQIDAQGYIAANWTEMKRAGLRD